MCTMQSDRKAPMNCVTVTCISKSFDNSEMKTIKAENYYLSLMHSILALETSN